ncbi:hypothetical protein [Clostridium botulinum]|uniref:hypothetical protein n=1 Tax=Clostridium botulinum TaxID=1491 RepID=UPI000773F1E6|nr:hypothetical protein [Clostridium botulinum]AUM92662.1 hypothetical protein RSJ5_15775 [Clostridium botulinum]NFB12108.1 hypothetical protein [Clostridium botulinum]NFH60214.1 hypothetical protein [Clostridium botulinum]NFJ87195.1 hypothetical protein [Clostridium botulinum]NFV31303.1 hypothetical protein [Clostridium botulinum]
MAISKDSKRIQFTLNGSKEKEREIIEFLNDCFNPNSTIKEIIYNYIVSNYGDKLQQVTQTYTSQSSVKLPKVTQNKNINNDTVSNRDKKLHEVDEIEQNEIEELNKFL